MSQRRYKQGENRQQYSLFPTTLDDQISRSNTIRAIDAYVANLDLLDLGFNYTTAKTGRGHPAYDPAMLIKLYLYGYIERIKSSRRLEKETYRNVEVMWLLDHLKPCYKTIADFRKDNAQALKGVNRDFIMLCRELGLFGGECVAVDGSFFRGDASKASIVTESKLQAQIAALNAKIESYQNSMNEQDVLESHTSINISHEDEQLESKLEQLKKRQQAKQQQLEQLQNSEEKQCSGTDPDARLLVKSGQCVAGYNVQSVVDDKYHLIVESDVVNDGNDQHQLYPMTKQAKAILEVDEITVLADAGYFESEQLRQCEADDITAYVPEPNKTKAGKKQGRFKREAFVYDASDDVYRCPMGTQLRPQGAHYKKGNHLIRYKSKATDCRACIKKAHCLTEKAHFRQLNRWVHEEVLERHRARMQDSREQMLKRASLVEHPFGTLKNRAGWSHHFLVRGFEKVRGELSIMTLCYNFTRVLNILGVGALIDYCHQRKSWGTC